MLSYRAHALVPTVVKTVVCPSGRFLTAEVPKSQ